MTIISLTNGLVIRSESLLDDLRVAMTGSTDGWLNITSIDCGNIDVKVDQICALYEE
jgi:hypothetical protein